MRKQGKISKKKRACVRTDSGERDGGGEAGRTGPQHPPYRSSPNHTDNEITATSSKGSLFSPILSDPGFFLQSGGGGGLGVWVEVGETEGASPVLITPTPLAPSSRLASPADPDNEKKKKKTNPPKQQATQHQPHLAPAQQTLPTHLSPSV